MTLKSETPIRSGAGLPPAPVEHTHDHAGAGAERRLWLSIALTFGIVLLEGVGGLFAGSLALIADAGHVLTDAFALGMTLFALRQARRPADERRTFGYHRVGIITALLNAASLIPISAFLVYEAVVRLFAPTPVEPGIMLVVAAVGLVANLSITAVLHGASHGSLNIQSAALHIAGDAAAAGGVLVGAVVIGLTGWTAVDPLLSILISILIAVSGLRLLRQTVRILLESVPADIRLDDVVAVMSAVQGVRNVHDLHVWQIAPGIYALSCHLLLDDQLVSRSARIMEEVRRLLDERFHIQHATIQPECANCDPANLYCALTPVESAHQHTH
jgi:cobalt-zinc-cadmium efflux system protein